MPRPRARPNNTPLKTMRIFCEGEKTEPLYLLEYIRGRRGDNRAAVVEVQSSNKNTPVQLVNEAVKFKKSSGFLPNDELWVVYDRESTAKYPDHLHAQAWSKAASSGVKIALSNVCFEAWILLHFVQTTGAYTCYDDLYKRSALNQKVQNLTGEGYNKAGRALFRHLSPFVQTARSRAVLMNKQSVSSAPPGAKFYQINPYTGVPDLLEAIDDFK